MWINFLKLKIKPNFFIKNIKKKNFRKFKALDNNKILIIINDFLRLKKNTSNIHYVKNIKKTLSFFSRLKLIIINNNLNMYDATLQLQIKKKQIITTINYKSKLIWFLSNGMLLKTLELSQKSKKKDSKVSIVNLKKSIEFFKKKIKKNYAIIRVVGSRNYLIKYINFLKNNFINYNCIYAYTPLFSFSKKNYKKIKSIKRKLKKNTNIHYSINIYYISIL